jgi:hypothetical protein
MSTLPVEQIAVPAALTLFLAWLFERLKPYLGKLAPFSQSNGNHAKNLRYVFFGVCAVAVLIFALVSGMAPHDLDSGILFAQRILTTAGFMTAGGHELYDQLSGNAAVRATDRKPVVAPVADKRLLYPPTNYDAGADLRASAGVADESAPSGS